MMWPGIVLAVTPIADLARGLPFPDRDTEGALRPAHHLHRVKLDSLREFLLLRRLSNSRDERLELRDILSRSR